MSDTLSLSVAADGAHVVLRCPFTMDVVNSMRLFPSRRWSNREGGWVLPLTKELIDRIPTLFPLHTVVLMDSLKQFLCKTESIDRAVAVGKECTSSSGFLYGTVPYPHQEKAVALCFSNDAFALFMEMGTGKTKVILDVCVNLQAQLQRPLRALVVAPLSVMGEWERNRLKHTPSLTLIQLMGSTGLKRKWFEVHKEPATLPTLLVMNYEAMWRLESELVKIPFDMIVLDEATKIKGRSTLQAKAIMRLGKVIPRRYILTGTPVANGPLDAFNLMKFIDPTVFGPSFQAFRDRYAIVHTYKGFPEIVGWRNMDEFSIKLASRSFRITKEQCWKDLPEKIFKRRACLLPNEQQKTYDSLVKTFCATVDGKELTVDMVLALLTKLRQITGGFIYKTDSKSTYRFPDNPKLEALVTLCGQLIAENKKIVVWFNFTEEGNLVQKALRQFKTHLFYGGTTPQDRASILDSFNSTAEPSIFIGQTRAGGFGIELTAAHDCIYYSNDYALDIRLQTEDRLHRHGQKNAVTYVDLFVPGTIDESILTLLEYKIKLSEGLLLQSYRDIIMGRPKLTS